MKRRKGLNEKKVIGRGEGDRYRRWRWRSSRR